MTVTEDTRLMVEEYEANQRKSKAIIMLHRMARYLTGNLREFDVELKWELQENPLIVQVAVYWKKPEEEAPPPPIMTGAPLEVEGGEGPSEVEEVPRVI